MSKLSNDALQRLALKCHDVGLDFDRGVCLLVLSSIVGRPAGEPIESRKELAPAEVAAAMAVLERARAAALRGLRIGSPEEAAQFADAVRSDALRTLLAAYLNGQLARFARRTAGRRTAA